MRIKNYVVLALGVLYYCYCKLLSVPLLGAFTPEGSQSPLPPRDILQYLKENAIFLVFFLLLISVASTSFLLSYLIYAKFDRNRVAAQTAARAGLFFLCIASCVIMGTSALDIFSSHVNTFDYICDVSMMLSALMFISYASTINRKKWLVVVDWLFTMLIFTVFIFSFFGVDRSIISSLVFGIHISQILLMMVCSFLHTREIFKKRSYTKIIKILLSGIYITLLGVSLLCIFFNKVYLYWLCFFSAIGVMSYLVFSELVDIAARQYTKTADLENYRKMAYTDALCNISNRNAFLLEQSETYDNDSLLYVVFDVNNLKRINDLHGHSVGDEIIKKSAEIIRESFIDIGKCFRIGGDEFAVIGIYKTDDEVKRALKNMLRKIDEYNSTSIAKLDLAYGYAIRDNTDINTYELFNKADRAMYRYKRREKISFLHG